MSTGFIEKLRKEIEETQKRRHDFVLKKFAFGGSLLGLGSLSVPVSDGLSITLLPLLYIVPLLAVSYDIYIVSEDYGIKRAGAFLRLYKKETEDTKDAERLWELFVNKHDRSLAPFGFFTVTITFLLGAGLLLRQSEESWQTLIIWAGFTLLIDGGLLIRSLCLRKYLKKATLPELNANGA